MGEGLNKEIRMHTSLVGGRRLKRALILHVYVCIYTVTVLNAEAPHVPPHDGEYFGRASRNLRCVLSAPRRSRPSSTGGRADRYDTRARRLRSFNYVARRRREIGQWHGYSTTRGNATGTRPRACTRVKNRLSGSPTPPPLYTAERCRWCAWSG